ncbi:MAG: NAD(P)/FAD-dependent oxidoreductase [Bryobacterales bacterium]|nr:NAD(P)/FAD-dependent oxidoreductase [Bryobacterales bacterium]
MAQRYSRRRILQAAGVAGAGLVLAGAYRLRIPSSYAKGKIVIIGGGAAGLDIAARLNRELAQPDITVVDPATTHFYQPGFTLIACGEFDANEVQREQSSLMPSGVKWLRESVVGIEPERNRITTSSNKVVEYDYLVLAPGLEMHFNSTEGITRDQLGQGNVHCIYDFRSAQECWQAIRKLAQTGGRAYFTDTWTKLKCGGAPKKINMMAEDYCRRQGTRNRVDFQLYTATDHLFEVQPFRKRLEEIYSERAIPITLNHRVKAVDTHAKRVTFEKHTKVVSPAPGEPSVKIELVTRDFDFLHIVPPMSAPKFVIDSPLAFDEATGKQADWVPADKSTLVHTRFKNVFVVGDVAGIPTSKTSAAIRMQAPVVAANLIATMENRRMPATYNGYTACPFVTEYGKVLMAEFDYDKKPMPTLPWIDPGREHRAGWILKRHVLRPMYFDLMVRGMA